MAVVVRYVDKLGVVKESFIGIAHVKDTSSTTLKQAVVSLLADNELSIDQVRGQGYDGASNMRGEFNGLKALILRDNPSAHYIHCFAHQLQLVIVAVAKKHPGVQGFYEYLSMVVNTVSASCKRKDMLREARKERVEKEIFEGVIKTGKGLNQEVSLARAGDTRWGSHHGTITSLIRLFSEVVDVLHYVKEEGDSIQQRSNAKAKEAYTCELQGLSEDVSKCPTKNRSDGMSLTQEDIFDDLVEILDFGKAKDMDKPITSITDLEQILFDSSDNFINELLAMLDLEGLEEVSSPESEVVTKNNPVK
ncbi:hypothetical protein L1987_23666 [Smallanthus sonchifolius]|uniref:Uncharacterized protein n=1 Tax=Smallanthus sonchifolius TaxID=185202 RepID=A0ACB9IKX1_9ASTR|nr:hypothetical protein L1987_23666 [Smallanthus sonchifolius]